MERHKTFTKPKVEAEVINKESPDKSQFVMLRLPHKYADADGVIQPPKNVVVKIHSRNNIIAAAHEHRGGISTEM